MKRVLLASLFAVLLAPASAQPPPPMQEADYFPLKKGTNWTYTSSGMTVTVRVVGEGEKIGKNLCARLETSLNGVVLNNEHVAFLTKDKDKVKDEGVYRCATGGQPIEPPLLILKLPPKKGAEWNVNSASVGEQVTGTFVVGEEEVPVTYEKDAKKKVKAVTVTGRELLVNGQRVTLTSSFAPGVGMIRQVGSVAGVTKTLELTAFTLAKE